MQDLHRNDFEGTFKISDNKMGDLSTKNGLQNTAQALSVPPQPVPQPQVRIIDLLPVNMRNRNFQQKQEKEVKKSPVSNNNPNER